MEQDPRGTTAILNSLAGMMPCATQYAAQSGIAEFRRLEVHQKVRTTIVYVTHDQVEAMTLADRVVVMNRGRIEQISTPNELYHKPATKLVANFIGLPTSCCWACGPSTSPRPNSIPRRA
jgi:ABC-type transporter Mla maintaining outer membrane lipid asymmetry ATPase subunit MlaF